MRATRLDWSREQESGNTCLCGGPSIYLTPLTSGGFLVCVISLQHHVAPPHLVADGHSFFFFFFLKLDPLILKALQIPFFLYSHHREGRRNFFLYHFGGRWFIKLRPPSTIWPVTSVLTTQTLQPWRLPSFSSFALILEKQVASSISRTNNLDPGGRVRHLDRTSLIPLAGFKPCLPVTAEHHSFNGFYLCVSDSRNPTESSFLSW